MFLVLLAIITLLILGVIASTLYVDSIVSFLCG